MSTPETRAVQARYARRDGAADAQRYSLHANAAALQAQQERLRAMARLWRAHGWMDLAGRPLLEVGCGSGGNLLDLLRLGATPTQLTGIELLPERAAAARAVLPDAVRLVEGDACAALITGASQQAVLAFTVFSSLLDPVYRQQFARTLWRWVAPGGGVLVYDFVVDNPRNPDVLKLPLAELQALFPQARLHSCKVTLAPPLARRLPAALIGTASLLSPLRTHRLTWAVKPT
ncbi:class I SAM-dependent methyltransferase [Acidovorax carolinensis]|uniref:class I SAM-dependent methyltransferase n=1 Tax=Acidovorax carolinensis TaxID=553814 RepID=UPI000B347251|nr:class I SAM-dependent methyltransferase [Acidovorax carolinensis]ART49063.1 SAM-dependent methyltransferase [Acidovorax carolinensis]